MAEPEPPIIRIAFQIRPEVKELLADLKGHLEGITEQLRKLGESFTASLDEILEFKQLPPGRGKAVISDLNPGPAAAGD